jgi:histidine ammonia-lyase
MNLTFNYGSGHLTSAIALSIASGKIKGVLSAEAIIRINQSQKHVQDIIDSKKTVYGINTGFGILANTVYQMMIQGCFNIKFCRAIV